MPRARPRVGVALGTTVRVRPFPARNVLPTDEQQMAHVHATYRLQFQAAFSFADAAALVPAFAALGISHLYCSPVFESLPGSRHGYDVSDPQRVREELGGSIGWECLSAAAAAQGLGLVADIVPNHLATRGNAWWNDVLAHGQVSRYWPFFDVNVEGDSSSVGGACASPLLIPLLEHPYGTELEAGRLTVVHEEGTARLAYGDERFPLAAESLEPLLAENGRNVDAIVARLNADREALHQLLERQPYRLTWWRLARDESPYRRFFDVNALVAVRMERDDVFEAMHALPFSWVESGAVDGLRVDHVDGLADPAAYLTKLRGRTPAAYLLVEKILGADEPWPGWPVHGTTGYEFGALVTRLLTAPEAEQPLSAFHRRFTGEPSRFDDVAQEARREMLSHWMLGDVHRVARILYDTCQASIQLRDYSEQDCLALVQELVTWAPVYRTYVGVAGPSAQDANVLGEMFVATRTSQPELPEPLLRHAAQLCLGPSSDRSFVTRLQQLCTATAAKAIEDTAFYRYSRFIAHNDVGADPRRFSESVASFHDVVRRWQADHPYGLRSTSTHDSKRSEDVRARLTVLSEMCDSWTQQVCAWSEPGLRILPLSVAGGRMAHLTRASAGARSQSRSRGQDVDALGDAVF